MTNYKYNLFPEGDSNSLSNLNISGLAYTQIGQQELYHFQQYQRQQHHQQLKYSHYSYYQPYQQNFLQVQNGQEHVPILNDNLPIKSNIIKTLCPQHKNYDMTSPVQVQSTNKRNECDDDMEKAQYKPIKKMKKANCLESLDKAKEEAAKMCIGVTYHGPSKKFRSRIKIEYRTTHLGYYDSCEKAAVAYDLAALQLRGYHARTNYEATRYNSIWEKVNPVIGSPRTRCLFVAKIPQTQDFNMEDFRVPVSQINLEPLNKSY